jgi:hypothetical protein
MIEEEDASEDTFNYYGVTIMLNDAMEVVWWGFINLKHP